MKLKYRRLFFYAYLGLFFLVAPLVVLYTAGYRYQWTTGQFVHTGAIAINSTPRSATVWIDHRNTGHHTSTLLKHILPGKYHLQLTREGYKSWERDVEVSSRQTSQIENAILFLDASPTHLLALSADVITASPDGNLLAYGTRVEPWFELWLYRLTEETYTLLDRLSTTETNLSSLAWNPDGTTLTLGNHIYQLESTAQNNTSIFTFNKGVDDVRVLLEQNGARKTVAVLPDGSYHVIQTKDNLSLLQESTRDRLVLLDTTTEGPPILLNVNATLYAWDGDSLYYSDGLELHRYRPSSGQNDLITRSSEPMKTIIAFPQGQTVMLVYQTTVVARDLSNLAHPVNTSLVTADRIDHFWIDQRGRTGYFVGSFNGQEGLFSLALTK